MNFARGLPDHPLLHALVHTGRRDVPVPVALRNTAAIVLPLAIGAIAGNRLAGLGIAVGALNTMFADQPGPYRLRMRRLLLTTLAAAGAAFAGSVLGQWPGALLAVAAVWGFGAALLVAIDPHATRAGLTSLILLLVMGAEPHPLAQALSGSLLIASGGVLQTLFAIAAWPLQRYRPERLALAAAYRKLATSARAELPPDDAVALPPSLNDLQALLFGAGHARGRAVEAFRVLAGLAERIRIELFALAHQQTQTHDAHARAALVGARAAAAAVIDSIAQALQDASPPEAIPALAAFAQAASACEAAGGAGDDPAGVASARLAALAGQLRAAVRNADAAGSRGELRAQQAEMRLPRALQSANPLAILRANLRLSSPACRHALRCAACVGIALAASHLLPLSRGYWMPMTVAIVLRPDFGATWRVGLLRVIGTLGGLLLTTAILGVGGALDFWSALALLAVLCFAFRELATVHYGVAVVCLTGLVVILLSFYGIPAADAVRARAIDTALGSALALLAYLLWPTWERGREREALANMLDAYRRYFLATVSGNAQARHETRVAARAARSSVQASLDRLRAEPASRAHLPAAEALAAQAHRVVRATMTLEGAVGDANPGTDPQIEAFARACSAALDQCSAILRGAEAPCGSHRLREARRAVLASMAEPGTPLDASLRDATDRIVDAIDSLLHILAAERPALPVR